MHISKELLNNEKMIDQEKIDLVARMGGDWYCRTRYLKQQQLPGWETDAGLKMRDQTYQFLELAFKKVIQLDPKNIDAWIDYSNFLFDNRSKSTRYKTSLLG